jgi:glycine hydroxymethyltransferase
MAAYTVFLKPGDTVLGMDFAHGGHLTHGSPVNFSGQLYRFVYYGVQKETGTIDFDQAARQAEKHRPKLIVTGASAYPRAIDFARFREIADSVGAFLMADIAHPAGLVATGLHPDPLPFCDIVTTTTHKILRGPRGGMILLGKDRENPMGIVAHKSGCVKMLSEVVDSIVMPGTQGGPLMHVITAKAVAFQENLEASYTDYCRRIIANAKAMAARLIECGYTLVSGGTDNHLMLVDLTNNKLTGKAATTALDAAGITVNMNMIPFDTKGPLVTSGIRIGTPAMTTRGMGEPEMRRIADFIHRVLSDPDNPGVLRSVKEGVAELCRAYPLYADLLP